MVQNSSAPIVAPIFPPPPLIIAALIAPETPIVLAPIAVSLESLQTLVSGRIECFPIDHDSDAIVGVCNDDGLDVFAVSRFNPATQCPICGTFLVMGDSLGTNGREFCSLTREQLPLLERLFGRVANPELLS